MKFTQIPSDTFKNLQMNAGILTDAFNPATGVIGNIIGATTGGVQFADAPEFSDFGDDIDNCPKNMKELKKLTNHAVTMSGTFVSLSADTAKMLVGAGDIDANDATHIIPRNDILDRDFEDVWWIGDYSDENTGDSAGFLAIHVLNALNTGGFQIQSSDKAKGQFAFSFEGHYSMDAQDTVPYEIFIKAGSSTAQPSINLNKHYATVEEDATVTLSATVVPADAVVTWASDDTSVATVSNGVVTGVAEGNTIVSASITVDGVTVNDTCTVVVTA